MQNHCVIFLTGSGQETGNINQTYNWNIKCIAETNKTSTLTTCVSIKFTCVSRRLISYNTYTLAIKAGKSGDNILCELSLNFKEFVIISQSRNHLIHVIGFVRIIKIGRASCRERV